MIATSGAALADAETIAAFERLMRLATLTTPNVPELAALGGHEGMQARGIAYLAKGGDSEGERIEDVLMLPGEPPHVMAGTRIHTRHTTAPAALCRARSRPIWRADCRCPKRPTVPACSSAQRCAPRPDLVRATARSATLKRGVSEPAGCTRQRLECRRPHLVARLRWFRHRVRPGHRCAAKSAGSATLFGRVRRI
jgi:hypothetical protein